MTLGYMLEVLVMLEIAIKLKTPSSCYTIDFKTLNSRQTTYPSKRANSAIPLLKTTTLPTSTGSEVTYELCSAPSFSI